MSTAKFTEVKNVHSVQKAPDIRNFMYRTFTAVDKKQHAEYW